MTGEQLSMLDPVCFYCGGPVVGSSTQGNGHVCRAHNEWEWGTALLRSGYWPTMGRRLIDSSGVRP